ncbi:MAG: hypothetical protein QM492_06580 [Rhodobacterales bacterium]
MEIRLYIGGHQTTTEHFTAALQQNKTTLETENIVFFPSTDDIYPAIFRASKAIQQGGNAEITTADLIERFTGVRQPEILVIVDNRIIGQEHRPFEKELFFPRPGGFIKQIQNIAQGQEVQLFIETRNIADFLPAIYADQVFSNIPGSFADFLAKTNPEELLWSNFINRAQGRGTLMPATVWQYEDYAYIWRDVMGAVSGYSKYQDLAAPAQKPALDTKLQTALLFYKYIQKYPVKSPAEFETLKNLFLEQNFGAAKPVTPPEWTQQRIQELTYSYEDDWYYIERMDEVLAIQQRVYTA